MWGDFIKKVLKAVAIVSIVSGVERVSGFIYRVFLSRFIGGEGMGIYQIAVSFLSVLLTLCCSGVPVTVSRTIASMKNNQEKNHSKVVSAGLFIGVTISLSVIILTLLSRDILSLIVTDVRVITLLYIMLPSLIFMVSTAVLRGIFWGRKDFLTYSLTELVEELSSLVIGVVLLYKATDLFTGVMSASFVITISSILGFIVTAIIYFIKGGRLLPSKVYLRPLLSSSTAITGMRTVSSLLGSLISIIVPMGLISGGLTNAEALNSFGACYGMAFPILATPSALIGSLALVLVPELAENYAKGDNAILTTTIEKALKFATLLACLIIPIFLITGREMGIVLYKDALAGKFIRDGAIMLLPMSISLISHSMLNSLGKEKDTLKSFLAGSVAMLLVIVFLTPIMKINALLLGFTLNYTITSLCNLLCLKKFIKTTKKDKYFFGISVLLVVPSIIVCKIFFEFLTKIFSLFWSIAFASVIILIFDVLLYLIFDIIDIKMINFKIKKKSKA